MGLGIKTRIKRMKTAFDYAMHVSNASTSDELNALLLCHALEKGMGVKNVKKGYGQEKAGKLVDSLDNLIKKNKIDTYSFKEGTAVLKAYFEYQQADGIDLHNLEEKAKGILEKDNNSYKAGYKIIEQSDLLAGKRMDLYSFYTSRHSMRMYSKEPVTDDEVLQAVDYAKHAPSACNRQPWKFYYSFNIEKINIIRNSVPKQSFLEDVPYFGVVTVDRELFGPDEINQWYVNGGIFLSFLTLAFHNLGIGSILLQYPTFSKSVSTLKREMSIKDTEEVIAIVGYGKYPEEAKCIYAQRRETNDIAVRR